MLRSTIIIACLVLLTSCGYAPPPRAAQKPNIKHRLIRLYKSSPDHVTLEFSITNTGDRTITQAKTTATLIGLDNQPVTFIEHYTVFRRDPLPPGDTVYRTYVFDSTRFNDEWMVDFRTRAW